MASRNPCYRFFECFAMAITCEETYGFNSLVSTRIHHERKKGTQNPTMRSQPSHARPRALTPHSRLNHTHCKEVANAASVEFSSSNDYEELLSGRERYQSIESFCNVSGSINSAEVGIGRNDRLACRIHMQNNDWQASLLAASVIRSRIARDSECPTITASKCRDSLT